MIRTNIITNEQKKYNKMNTDIKNSKKNKTANKIVNLKKEKVFANNLEPFRILKSIVESDILKCESVFTFKKTGKNIYKCALLPNIIIGFKSSEYKGHFGVIATISDKLSGQYISSKFIKRIVVTNQDADMVSNLNIEDLDSPNLNFVNYSSNPLF